MGITTVSSVWSPADMLSPHNLLNLLLVCTLLATAKAKYDYSQLNEENEVDADEVYPPQEVDAIEISSTDEVDAQLIKRLEEILNKREVGQIDEVVDIQEVLNREPVSKLTPLNSVKEDVDVKEVVDKTEIPKPIVEKFLKWRFQQRARAEYPSDDDYEEGAPTDSSRLDKLNQDIKVIDQQLVEKMNEIKNLEEVVSMLKVKKMEEVKKEPIIHLEELVNLYQLSEKEVDKLKKMMKR